MLMAIRKNRKKDLREKNFRARWADMRPPPTSGDHKAVTRHAMNGEAKNRCFEERR